MIIAIRAYTGAATVLAGKPAGRQLLATLLGNVYEPTEPTVAFLDFHGIDVVTGSFLREGPVSFRDIVRSKGSNLYPVFANCTAAIVDDLAQLLEDRGDAMLVCDIDSDSSEIPKNTILIGKLDEKQLLTFRLLREHGELDASGLAKIGGETVGPTAWNNRLAALAAKGIVVERSYGRLKRYRLSA
jgi:hypothetical protein